MKEIENIESIKNFAIETIRQEMDAIKQLMSFVDDDFAKVIKYIFESKGRVIITGVGKSALIASKIVATLNSTGTPAIFMHAADAIHGDLGIIQDGDTVICISNSGNTPEIKVVIPLIRNIGNNKIVAMVGKEDSFLARASDFVINTHVNNEACPNNLAPTSSTTAQLVMGDALAMTLLKMRGFSREDYAKVHPGGALGKKLFMKVSDIISKDLVPKVSPDATLNEIIIEISSKMLGATGVVDANGKLLGIITDGDLRRMLQRGDNISAICAKDIMSKNPKATDIDELAVKAFNKMEEYKITQLIVLEEGKYCGLIHIHDILREGLV